MKVVTGSNVVRKGLSHESRAEGTTVTVRDLFYNRPVQRKMMWNARRSTELLAVNSRRPSNVGANAGAHAMEHVKQSIRRIALIHPGISFTMYNLSKGLRVLQSSKMQSMQLHFGQLFGSNRAANMLPLQHSHGDFNVEGLMQPPPLGHHSKEFQFLFINRRSCDQSHPLHKLIASTCHSGSLDHCS